VITRAEILRGADPDQPDAERVVLPQFRASGSDAPVAREYDEVEFGDDRHPVQIGRAQRDCW
jgi:hypothetical protein